MVKSFSFARTPKILFRTGQILSIPDIVSAFGKRMILVTGKRSFSGSKYFTSLVNALDTKGITYNQVSVEEEPSPELIDDTVKKLSDKPFDAVLAIGGGSVLDAGKAISAMMYKTSVVSYLEGVGTKEHPGTKLPVIAAPTTSGTGSEATKNAVISRTGKDGFKKSLRHDNFVPDIAVVDPELTLGCPPDITAASGMDCFTQLTEAYLSTHSDSYTDALAIEGLKAVRESLRASVLDGENIEARTGMSFAALTSGICLANAGLGTVHGFASSMGGFCKIPHGVICGTLMAAVNKANVSMLKKAGGGEAKRKYVNLGKLFLDAGGKSDDFYMDGFIKYLEDLTAELNIPRLGKYGLDEKEIENICSITENKYNPVKLDSGDLIKIVLSRL